MSFKVFLIKIDIDINIIYFSNFYENFQANTKAIIKEANPLEKSSIESDSLKPMPIFNVSIFL